MEADLCTCKFSKMNHLLCKHIFASDFWHCVSNDGKPLITDTMYANFAAGLKLVDNSSWVYDPSLDDLEEVRRRDERRAMNSNHRGAKDAVFTLDATLEELIDLVWTLADAETMGLVGDLTFTFKHLMRFLIDKLTGKQANLDALGVGGSRIAQSLLREARRVARGHSVDDDADDSGAGDNLGVHEVDMDVDPKV